MSEAKDDFLYISHVLDSIKAVETYTEGIDYNVFCSNPLIYDAVIRKYKVKEK